MKSLATGGENPKGYATMKAKPLSASLKRRTGMTQTRVSDALRGGWHDGALSAGVFMPTE